MEDGAAGGPQAVGAAGVPRAPKVLQITPCVTGLRHRAHGLCRVVLGPADPGHAVAAGIDQRAAYGVQQFALIVRLGQRQVAAAEHVQRAVDPAQALFGLLALGDVARQHDEAGVAVVRPCHARHRQLEPGPAVRQVEHDLSAHGIPHCVRLAQGNHRFGRSRRRQHIVCGPAQELRRRHRQQLEAGRVVTVVAAFQVHLEQQVGNRVQRRRQRVLGGAQLFYGFIALGDVGDGDDDAADAALCVVQGKGIAQHPQRAHQAGTAYAEHEVAHRLSVGKHLLHRVIFQRHGPAVFLQKGPVRIGGRLAAQQPGLQADDAAGRRVGLEDLAVQPVHDNAGAEVVEQGAQAFLVGAQGCLHAVVLGDVAEDDHDAGELATGGANRSGTVGDPVVVSVARPQQRAVGDAGDLAPLQHAAHEIGLWLHAAGVEDAEHLGQRPPDGFSGSPARQLLGNRVDAHDPARGVGGKHAVADRVQRRGQVLLAVAQPLFGPLAPGDVQVSAGHAQRAAVGGSFDDHTPAEDPHLVAVGVAGTHLGFEVGARRVQDHLLQQTVELGPVVGVHARMPFVERRHRAFRV